MAENEGGLRKAFETILAEFDIKLDPPKDSEDEFSDVIHLSQEKLDELNQKAEEIYQQTGMSREQLEAYASNPNNFSKEQWDALQRVREELERLKRKTQENVGKNILKESPQTERSRKTMRFGKKKNWIPL